MGKGIVFFLGLLIFFTIFFFALAVGGALQGFLYLPSLLLVLGTAGGLGLAGYRGDGLVGFINSCKKHLITAGVLVTIIGVIQLLQNLSNPDDLGGGLAVALLGLLYSVVLFGIAEAFLSIVGTEQIKAN